MRKCRVVLAFLIVLALALGVSAYGATSPVPGSFLKQRVNSVPELVKHVSSNKLVSSRYTQHFKMSKPALVAYFQDNLKLSTLRKPTVVSVYYINKANKIVKGKRLLPTGTAVFMTKTGEPVLDWRCGNPLRAQLPVVMKQVAQKPATVTTAAKAGAQSTATAKAAEPAPTKVTELVSVPDAVEKVLANPPTEVATLPFATAPVITAETLAPTVVTAAPAVTPPVVEAVATAPVAAVPPIISSGGGGFNFLLPAAVLGGLGAAFAGGGGGGGNPPAPVPEPSGMAALATGVLGIAGLYMRRPRR